MTPIPRFHFAEPDRRDLFRALRVLAATSATPRGLGVSLDVLLNDLELYDDPAQGRGSWKTDDEAPPVEALAEWLHAVIGSKPPRDAGRELMEHPDVEAIRIDAGRLAALIERNGGRPFA